MLRQRIITGIICAPILFAIIWFGNPWFALGIAAIAVIAGWEFYKIASSIKINPLTYFGLIVILILAFSVYLPFPDVRLLIIILSIIISLIWMLFRLPKENAFSSWVWTMAGILYLGLMLSYWGELRELPQGRWLVLWAILIIIACDSAAYFTGRSCGKHLLAPKISPKKTWEGAAGGLAASIIISVVLGLVLSLPLNWWQLIISGIVISILGQLGDLIESILKRNAGVKDTGNFFPGHGGVMDRIDSYILIGPLLYYVIYFAL